MLDTTDEFPSMKCYLADAEDLHKRLRRVIEEREVAYGDDPMGKTGLCDRKFKIQGSREYPVIVEQYTTDFGLLRAMREIEKKVAIFTGQWGKKREKAVATPEARGLTLIEGMTDAERAVLELKLLAIAKSDIFNETDNDEPMSYALKQLSKKAPGVAT